MYNFFFHSIFYFYYCITSPLNHKTYLFSILLGVVTFENLFNSPSKLLFFYCIFPNFLVAYNYYFFFFHLQPFEDIVVLLSNKIPSIDRLIRQLMIHFIALKIKGNWRWNNLHNHQFGSLIRMYNECMRIKSLP